MSIEFNFDAITQWVFQTCGEFGVELAFGDSDFFACGGTSLLAIRLISKVDSEIASFALSPASLYENPTLDGIVTSIMENLSVEYADR